MIASAHDGDSEIFDDPRHIRGDVRLLMRMLNDPRVSVPRRLVEKALNAIEDVFASETAGHYAKLRAAQLVFKGLEIDQGDDHQILRAGVDLFAATHERKDASPEQIAGERERKLAALVSGLRSGDALGDDGEAIDAEAE